MTFEHEEPVEPCYDDPDDCTAPFTASTGMRQEVVPRIDTQEAFCGHQSVFFPNAFGEIRNDWRYDKHKTNNNVPMNT